jgi:GlpG protein
MRQIATLADGDQARTLADHLLTLQIETRLEPEPGGWGLWVCDEDRVAQARQELAEFTRNPADPRYAGAGRAAEALRRQEARADQAYARKQVNLRDRFAGPGSGTTPLTYALIALSVVATLSIWLNRVREQPPVLSQALSIAPYGDWYEGRGLERIRHGEVWRLVTPAFLHSTTNVLHLLFNMLMLRSLGALIEARRGTGRLLLLVLATAVISNLAQYYWGVLRWHPPERPLNPAAFGGMSGVLYGLFGYAWMKSRFEPALGLWVDQNTVLILIGWFFLCMTGFVGPIANAAHAGGLVSGMVLGVLPPLWRRLWPR